VGEGHLHWCPPLSAIWGTSPPAIRPCSLTVEGWKLFRAGRGAERGLKVGASECVGEFCIFQLEMACFWCISKAKVGTRMGTFEKNKLRRLELLMKLHLRATGSHLPYEITQFYLPPDTSERTPLNRSQRAVLD